MALSFTDYTAGGPITPNVNYKFSAPKPGDFAYLLISSVAEATLQLTETLPTDEEWSNVETYVVNGPIAGRIFPLSATNYYFRVVGPPSLTYDSTLAIKDLDLEWPMDITPTAIPTDGSPIISGFYSLDALSLAVGKFHSFSIVPAKSGNLVGKHEASDQHRFVATIFGVNAQGYPVSHMTSFANMEQSIFNMDTAKAVLHLSAPEGAQFNYTCSIASFSSGSGGSLTPSSDANITGAWSFTNITVPTPTQAGQAANKGYVDAQIATVVKTSGAQNVGGVKTFTDGLTLADEKPLNLGAGRDAIKIHGSAEGAAVIEGGNGSTLDVAVPTTFQGLASFEDPISFSIVPGSEQMQTLMEQIHPTVELYGSKWTYIANSGYLQLVQRNNTVWVTFDPTGNVWFRRNFEVQGPATFTQGVTIGQTLTVAGEVTLRSPIKIGDGGVHFYGQRFDDKASLMVYPETGLGSDRAVMFLGTLDEGSSGVFSSDGLVITQASGDARYALKSEVTSGLTPATADARYGKLSGDNTWRGIQKFAMPPQVDDGGGNFKISLTVVALQQAAYDDLASKDDYTMYRCLDTEKVYLGTIALN